jgi:hypothetical protein
METSIVMEAIAVGSWGKAKGCDALFEVLEVIVRGKFRTLKCIYRSTALQTPKGTLLFKADKFIATPLDFVKS